jgi:hypothetical protein
VKQLLMGPSFPDLVGEWAARHLDDKARIWTVTRGEDGGLEERLDPSFLALIDEDRSIDELVDVILTAAAEQDIAETRIW